MNTYRRNKTCSCPRCRVEGLLWAVFFITLGVLFLLDTYHVVRFDTSWPTLLIVIGVCLFVGRSTSSQGHIQPYWAGGPPPGSTRPVNHEAPHE